jgi:hypothetical protein
MFVISERLYAHPLRLFEQSSCFFIIKHNFSFCNSFHRVFFIFQIVCNYTTKVTEFWYLLYGIVIKFNINIFRILLLVPKMLLLQLNLTRRKKYAEINLLYAQANTRL